MITTTVDSQSHIITTTYKGKINAHDIIEYIDKLNIEIIDHANILYLEDQREADFTFSTSEIRKIVYFLFVKIRDLRNIRVAILNSQPKETAFSLLAIRLLKNNNVHAKVFSTCEAATDWLLLDKTVRKTI